MNESDCTRAISGFGSGDPSRLEALPPTCTLDDVKAALSYSGGWSRGVLAGRHESLEVHSFSSAALRDVKAWIDPHGHVVLLDASMPSGSEVQYRKRLGEPDAKLDYVWKGLTLQASELVWLKSGAVVVANAERIDGVLRVGVFAAGVSLDTYKQQLRYVPEEEEEAEPDRGE